MKIPFKYFCLQWLAISLTTTGFCQVSLSGPTCVAAGTVYQYRISGNWDSSSTMQVCLTNGMIADSTGTSTCTPAAGAPLSTVLVIWNPGLIGSLTLSSNMGNTSFMVTITPDLLPGIIDSTDMQQSISIADIPAPINCSPATGGSCNPSYNYQWQQSLDMVNWSDISDATGQNLNFTSPIPLTTFFRRKITDTVSGSIGYSNVANVDVLLNIPQADSSSGEGGGDSLMTEHVMEIMKPEYQQGASKINSNPENELVHSIEFVCKPEMRLNCPDKKLDAFNSSTVLYA